MPLRRSPSAVFLLALASVASGLGACGDGGGKSSADDGAVTDAAPAADATTVDGAVGDATLPPDAAALPPDAAPPGPAFCTGATGHRWDPLGTAEPDFFPDGMLVRADATSPSGYRLEITAETAPWTLQAPDLLKDAFQSMNRLTGFGAMGGALFRFTAPVNGLPTTADESVTNPGWQLWDLGQTPPVRVPFEIHALEGGLTVELWPLRPLHLATMHALVVTRAAHADDGDCIAPAPTTQALLGSASVLASLPDAARVSAFAPAYQAALAQLGVDPADVSVLSVFPTHDDLAPVRAAAADVQTRPVAWGAPGDCTEADGLIECQATTTVLDYRDDAGVVDGGREPREGEIPVTYWLPATGTGPFPVVVYGHGLNSHRDEGREFAVRVAERGLAVIAMEAVEHGDHPFIADPSGEDAMRFLGIDLAHLKIDAPRLAGNFNQTNVDRIRLIHLIRTDGDPNGDGVPDFDTTRVAYLGASLGAMCGAGLLALSPDLDAGALTIGGARLVSVVTDTALVAQYKPLIGNLVGSVEAFDRLVPILQHVIDAADPGTWGAHVLQDRFDGRTPPSVYASYGMSDEVVPPAAGRSLARALGAPQLSPVRVPVDLVDVIDDAPVVGNRENGTRTSAFYQLDTVTRDGESRPATHVATAKSDEVAAQIRAFLGAWADGDVPTIVRP